jgi:pimeloyl-ACP methyl ester carboxylesterase
MEMMHLSETRYLDVSGGRLAYEVAGAASGPLVVCAPGMGDLRGEYRYLTPRLMAAGYRVAALDVRGHGETSARWDDYTVAGVGADMLALARALGADRGRRAFLIGTSMAGGAAIWAAAEAPEEIAGVVLINPFVRDADGPLWLPRLLYGTLFARPWGPSVWMRYFASLYPTAHPADFAAYTATLRASFDEPGRFHALRQMLFASKAASAARVGRVTAPALIVMGTKDRDFRNPAAEGQRLAGDLSAAAAEVRLIEGGGHYPHAELPDQTTPVIVEFLDRVRAGTRTQTGTVRHGA